MNTHGITIEETFESIGHAVNNGSYNIADFLFNFVFGSLFVATFVFIIWTAVAFIRIHNDYN